MFGLLLFLISPFLALAGATNLVTPPQTQNVQNQTYTYSGACWNPENNTKFELKAQDLDSYHAGFTSQPACRGAGLPFQTYGGRDGLVGVYSRVRENLVLADFKVLNEGTPFTGGCADGKSAIRQVAKVGGKDVYWINVNRKGQKLYDFLYVMTGHDNDGYHMDIYASDAILADPVTAGYGHIVECDTKGGLIPVVETNSNALPPQIVSFTEIDKTGFEENYNRFANPIGPTQKPGTIGPTLPPTNGLFPPYMTFLAKVEQEDVPDAALPDGQIGKVTRVVKNSTHIYEVFFHAGDFYLRDISDGSSYIYEPTNDSPQSTIIRNPSLQLGVLRFRLSYEWNPYQPTCKPAIYLYPSKPTDISVKVFPEGYMTKSIPDYNGGWNVRANPDGRIESESGKNYQYLYYEADIKDVPVPKEGFVVPQGELGKYFDSTLSALGLNAKETQDFKDYWVSKLTGKPYYFVTLLPKEVIDAKEPLDFSQKPDTIIRVRFLFEGLDKPIEVKALSLPPVPARRGFTVVDWGGGVVGGTCADGSVENQIIK